ncbi:MAG: glycosyltransferase family 39 protein, partial [Calditrichia bacterium]|nr:glycosyltransferase family 39 protein [Calditrichia bacterium]
MPFYSLILTAAHFIIPDWVIAARLISYTALVLTIIPVYLLTEHIFNRKAAFWASLAFALAPVPNGWVVNVTRGPIFILFFIWAVYYSIQAISFAQKRYFILSCVFSWLAVLCRIEGIIIIPFCLIFFLYMALRERQERTPLIIGVIICLAFPLLFYALGSIILGPQAVSMNRIDNVGKYVNDFYHLKFMDNYNHIYSFLKAAENSPPFSGWNQNFAAISRHYIPFIYLLGLLEMLVKIIFPLYTIPFFYGIKHSFSRAHFFIAGLVGSYLLMVYYHQFVNDYASKRFVFVPAVLLFPWIGKGMESIFNKVKTSKQKLIAILLLVCFIIFPLGKLFNTFSKQDKVIVTAGKWLAGKQELRDVRLITNDPRIPFYAGRDAFSSRNKNFWFPKNKTESYLDMEKEAISSQAKLMIVRT